MFNQLAGRLDLAKSSFYSSTTPVTGVDYPQRAITSERRLPGFSQFIPGRHAAYSVLKTGDGAKPG